MFTGLMLTGQKQNILIGLDTFENLTNKLTADELRKGGAFA